MLTILKTVILAFAWLVLPILVGCLFGLLPHREYRKRRSAYLIGSLTIWALFYGLARIALDGKWTLTKLTRVFCILLIVLTILSTGVIIYRWNIRALIRIKSRANLFITVIAALLVIVVAGGFAANRTEEHTVEQVMTMYMTDSLYEYDAMTGKSRADMMDFEKETLDAPEGGAGCGLLCCVCQNEQSASGKVCPDSAAGVFTSVLYGGVCRVGRIFV